MATVAGEPAARGSAPPMVGRDADLARLLDALRAAPSVVVVEGDAGIGKSRLIREALARLDRGDDVLIAESHPLPDPFPLGPAIAALETAISKLPSHRLSNPLLGALRPLFPEAQDRLPPPPDPLGEPGTERHRLFRAIAAAIDAAAPRVIVFEDIHWSDPATLDLLSLLVAAPTGDRTIVLTSRPDDAATWLRATAMRPSPRVRRESISLAPLDRQGLRALTEAILDSQAISQEFIDYLHERTGGVPFALEELLRLLQDRRDLVLHQGRWSRRELSDIRVPAAIRDSVLERVHRLHPDARAVVRAMAVLRVPSTEQLVGATAALDPARAAAASSEALRAAVLREDEEGRLAFRHGLAAQAVHEAIPGPQRRRLHHRAGRAIEEADPSQTAALAEHFRLGGEAERAARYAEQAAEAASALFDDRAAARFLRTAFELTPSRSRGRARLAAKLGDAALHGLAHREAAEVLREMVEESSLPAAVRGELRFSLARLLLQAGDMPGATAQFRAAVPELRRSPALQARTMASLGYPWTREGHLSEHLRWLRRAVAAAERQDDPEALLAVRVDRATVLVSVGRREGWKAVDEIGPDDGSPAATRHRARAALNLCEASIATGHLERARRFAAECRAIAEAAGYARPLGVLAALEMALDFILGRWDGLGERAGSMAAEGAPGGQVIVTRLVRALHASAVGGHDGAQAELAEVLDLATREGAWFEAAQAAGGIARLRLASGDPEGALEAAAGTLEILRGKGIWAWLADPVPVAVEALLRLGRADEAKAIVAEMEKGLRGVDAPAARAALAESRGLLAEKAGDLAAAARRFRSAERAWRALPDPYRAARSLEATARCVTVSAGRELGLRALEEYDALGAGADAARVRADLRRRGVTLGHRRGRRGYGDRLSPREAEIARLAAAGQTNREMAAALYLSVRTVDAHMSRILRKLGARNRRELAEADID